MRLDVFLKLSRLVPRRSVAQKFCDAGLVSLNGLKAKSSKELKAGDVLEIRRGDRVTKYRVSRIPETKNVKKQLAFELYEILKEKTIDDQPSISPIAFS